MSNVEKGTTNGIRPEEVSCCKYIPLKQGVVIFSIMGTLISFISGGVRIAEIAQHVNIMRKVDLAVASIGLSFWMLLAAISIFGFFAVWRERRKHVTVYFSLFTFHWVLDLVSTIVFLVHAFHPGLFDKTPACGGSGGGSSDGSNDRIGSSSSGLESCLKFYPKVTLILMVVGVTLFKIVSAYAAFVIFSYMRKLQLRDHQNTSPSSTKWKPSFTQKMRGGRKRPWPPRQIPEIKIDFASDQSSASCYSDSGGQVLSFATKYPSLDVPIDEDKMIDITSDMMRSGGGGGEQRKVQEDIKEGILLSLPVLPKYSVVGSEKAFVP